MFTQDHGNDGDDSLVRKMTGVKKLALMHLRMCELALRRERQRTDGCDTLRQIEQNDIHIGGATLADVPLGFAQRGVPVPVDGQPRRYDVPADAFEVITDRLYGLGSVRVAGKKARVRRALSIAGDDLEARGWRLVVLVA